MRIEKAIILKGKNNSGKTHSLKKLIDRVDGFKQTEESVKIQEKRKDCKDTYALLKNKRDEYILVITGGDCVRDYKNVDNAEKRFKQENLKIKYLIMACRTKGKLLNLFRAQFKNNLIEIDAINRNESKNINNILNVLKRR